MGEEDVELPISWVDLVGEDTDATAIVYNGAEGGGELLLNGQPVEVGSVITKEQVSEGQLSFMPDSDEAGFDGYPNEGLGNQKEDYAKLDYTIQTGADGELVEQPAELTIDIMPVVDVPEVHINVTPRATDTEQSQVTEVNGGSRNPDGTGFDLVDGKIVAIGENVCIWYTNTSTGSTRENNVVLVQDLTDEEVNAIIANSLKHLDPSSTEYQSKFERMKEQNFKSYSQQGNVHGSDGMTDIFILHEGSLYEQNKQTDNQGTTYHSYPVNSVKGNAGGAPDFIYLLETEGVEYKVNGVVSHEEHIGNYNHNDNWNITADGKHITQGSNQLAGTITSSGGYIGNPGHVVKPEPSEVMAEYEVSIMAHVTDLDGSESMMSELVLRGLPEGAEVVHGDTTYIVNSSGELTIVGEFSNYELADSSGIETQVSAEIVIRVPEGAEFKLEVEAKAYEHHGAEVASVELASFASLLSEDEGWDWEAGILNDESSGGSDVTVLATDEVASSSVDSGDADISDLVSDEDVWIPGLEPEHSAISDGHAPVQAYSEDEVVSGPSQEEIDQAAQLVDKLGKFSDGSDGHH